MRVLTATTLVGAAVALFAAPTGEADPTGGASVPSAVQMGNLKAASGPADKGAPAVATAVSSKTAFVAGHRVRFTYRVGADDVKVRIALVRLSDGDVVKKWRHTGPSPDAPHSVQWKPRSGDGRYAFRLTAAAPTGAQARNAADDDQKRDAFDLYGYAFPLHAHHEYGDGFGAGRGHEGQDVFARCGAGIYAARGGTVQMSKYHSAAGNYVVIDGAGTGRDHMYAHLREPSPLAAGDRVYTGQRIGSVGDTGDAVGCHLHFELWSAPGWYEGGHAVDPTRYLKRWDKYS